MGTVYPVVEIKPKDTKSMISDVALELFKEHGFQNVTINEICKACKITKRTFYYHWISKDEILSQFVENTGIESKQLVDNLLEQKGIAETIWAIFDNFFVRDIINGTNITKQIFHIKLDRLKSENFPYGAPVYSTVNKLIRIGFNSGELVPIGDPDGVCLLLFHMMRSTSFTWAAQNGDFDLQAETRKAFDTLIVPSKKN
ncbi:MAG: TetR/AcrR family transcriptional regulator [Sphaerochaetaceae bacterium]|nr:TetR/AcrR family transcriptional regulator [Sphaerochaetaceae bacterium]